MSTDTPDIKEVVKQKYGEAALRVTAGGKFLLRRHGDGDWELLRSHYRKSV